MASATHPPSKRVLIFGASGTAGRATALAAQALGHHVTCYLRPDRADVAGCATITGTLADADLTRAFTAPYDAVISCLASRSGTAQDAWDIDHRAQSRILAAAKTANTAQFILLSAICVQKPLLAFQHAKLAFEADLTASGLTYSIIRPTAFFKSLSGQIDRVRAGKAFLLFGDGQLTACKPISDRDLGAFIASCLTDPARHNQILPIGGPGPAITPLDQAAALFELTGKPPKLKRVPVAMMDVIGGGLRLAGRINRKAAAKGELARIGRYYATESMLVWDPVLGRYDADATPESGRDTLFEFYAQVLRGEAVVERGDHAVF